MANIPLVALQGGRTSGAYPPEYATPLGQLGQIIGVQKGMLDMQQTRQVLQARQQAAQIMANSPPDQMSTNLVKSGVYAWAPDVGNMMTNRDNAMSEINARSTLQSTNASEAWIKAASAYAMTDHPTPEGFEAIRRQYGDNIADPAARANFNRYSQDAGEALFGGLPSLEDQQADGGASAREILKNRAMGQIAGAVGTWPALSEFGLGGPVENIGSAEHPVLVQRPFSAPPGTLEQLNIGGGGGQWPVLPAQPQQGAPAPTSAAPPAVAPPAATPNALQPPSPLPPPDQYQPGQVQASPLGPLSTTPPAAPATRTPQPVPAAPAPPTAPPTVAAGVAGGGGGGGVPPPVAGVNMPPGWQPGSPYASATVPPRAPPPAPPPGSTPAPTPAPTPAFGPGVSQHQTNQQGVPISIADGRPLWTGNLAGRSPVRPQYFDSRNQPVFPAQFQKDIADADEQFKALGGQYRVAQNLIGQTSALRDDFDVLQRAGGWSTPNQGLPARMDAMRAWDSLMSVVGGKQVGTFSEAAFTSLQKTATTMGFDAVSSHFGVAREAFGTLERSIQMVPGTTNTFVGGQLVNRMFEAMAQRQLDQYQYEQSFRMQNGNGVTAEQQYNADHPITDTIHEVMKEFGLTADGFRGATPQETWNNIRTAQRAGILTTTQATNLLEGKPAGDR